MLPSRSGILAEAISIAFTSAKRWSISPASFLQCPYLHQSRFPILICNKSAAKAWICLVSFSWLSFQSRSPILLWNKTADEAYVYFQSSHRPLNVLCTFNLRPVSSRGGALLGVLKHLANFIGNHLCWSFFLIKLQFFRAATLLKRDSNTGIFLWNLQNF